MPKEKFLLWLALDWYSLDKVEFVLRGTNLTNVVQFSYHYLIFLVNLLLFLHIGISKKLKESIGAYLSSQKKELILRLSKNYCKKLSLCKQQMLNF